MRSCVWLGGGRGGGGVRTCVLACVGVGGCVCVRVGLALGGRARLGWGRVVHCSYTQFWFREIHPRLFHISHDVLFYQSKCWLRSNRKRVSHSSW